MATQNPKILLFLDNTTSHPNLKLTNIQLYFFPPIRVILERIDTSDMSVEEFISFDDDLLTEDDAHFTTNTNPKTSDDNENNNDDDDSDGENDNADEAEMSYTEALLQID